MTPKEEIVKIYARSLMRKVDRQDGFPLMREEIEKLFHGALDEYRESFHVPQYDIELKLANEKVEELTGKCIQKNTEYQIMLRLAQEQRARAEKAERLTNGIKGEAQGYRDDHMKLVRWMCDNGFGDSYGNPTKDILTLMELAQEKIKTEQEYIELLLEELEETVSIAFCHGWRSSRFEAGKQLRDKLKEIDQKIENVKLSF